MLELLDDVFNTVYRGESYVPMTVDNSSYIEAKSESLINKTDLKQIV